MATLGPTFAAEIAVAGLLGLPFAWSSEGVTYGESLSAQDRRRVEAAVAAHDPTRPGPEPVPETISDRQFAQALALAGTITQGEALAWAARGDLPAAMTAALAKIPEADGRRFGAQMLLSAATTYERRHPLTDRLGTLLGHDAAALDALWTRAAAL